MTTTRDLDAALRTLDPTSAADTDGSDRAAADLHRILATDPSTSPTRPTGTAPRQRTARRTVLAGGLVAAATTGLLVLPPVLGGGASAFASWTAYPTGLSPEQGEAAVEACNAVPSGVVMGGSAEPPSTDVAIVERRGDWTFVVSTGPDGFFSSCLIEPESNNYSTGATGMGARVPKSDDVLIRSGGTDSTMEAGDVSVLAGLAGEDVTDVSYHSQGHGEVVATVKSGAWALWFPGDELEDKISLPEGVEVQVGYRDGSTETITLAGECNRGTTDERC